LDFPTLRVARSSQNIEALKRFYRDGLGLDVLDEFTDHDGFSGIIFGKAGAPYHFEFTCHRSLPAGRAPTQDSLLVFYVPDEEEWKRAVQQMTSAAFLPVSPANPYWDRLGRTFEDPDGFRIVLQNASWS
jgi:catechol 2,3-dioxygenase-like lactoylglutathione lyase family enzyme